MAEHQWAAGRWCESSTYAPPGITKAESGHASLRRRPGTIVAMGTRSFSGSPRKRDREASSNAKGAKRGSLSQSHLATKAFERARNTALETPVGKMSLSQWHEIIVAMQLVFKVRVKEPLHAFQLFDRMHEERVHCVQRTEPALQFPTLSVVLLGEVIMEWSRNKMYHKPVSSFSVFDRLLMYEESGVFEVDSGIYVSLLAGSKKRVSGKEAYSLAQDVLCYMKTKSNGDYMHRLHPTAFIYNLVLALIVSSGAVSARETEQLANELISLYEKSKHADHLRPDDYTFSTVISAWSKSTSNDAAERAQDIFNRGEAILGRKLSPETHNSLAFCFSKKNPDKAYEILQRRLDNDGDEKSLPDASAFSHIISSYGRLGECEKARNVYTEVLRLYETTKNEQLRPCHSLNSSLLLAYAKAGKVEDAELFLRSLIEQAEIDKNEYPNVYCWNAVILAWQKSPVAGSYERAKDLLKEMQNYNVSPDEATFAILLNFPGKRFSKEDTLSMLEEAIASGVTLRGNAQLSAIRGLSWSPASAEEVLDLMISQSPMHLETKHFNAVMTAWSFSQRKESHLKMTGLVSRMDALSEKGLQTKPDIISFNILVNFYAQQEGFGPWATDIYHECVRRNLPIDGKFMSAVCQAWSKTTSAEAAQRAEEVFREMGIMVKPTEAAYNSLISCLSRNGNPSKAQHFFDELKTQQTPSYKTYNTILSAWSKAGKPQQASGILKEMIATSYHQGKDGPRTPAFNQVLRAWSTSGDMGAGRQIEEGINQMLHLSDRFDVLPNGQSYALCIDAYLRSHDIENAIRMWYQFLSEARRRRDSSLFPCLHNLARILPYILHKNPRIQFHDIVDGPFTFRSNGKVHFELVEGIKKHIMSLSATPEEVTRQFLSMLSTDSIDRAI